MQGATNFGQVGIAVEKQKKREKEGGSQMVLRRVKSLHRRELPKNGRWITTMGELPQQADIRRLFGCARGRRRRLTQSLSFTNGQTLNLATRRLGPEYVRVRWDSSSCNLHTFLVANVDGEDEIKQIIGIHRKRKGSRWLFHGTSPECARRIMQRGFDPSCRRRDLHGAGEYFTPFYDYACSYGSSIIVAEVSRGKSFANDHIVVCDQPGNATPRVWIQHKSHVTR